MMNVIGCSNAGPNFFVIVSVAAVPAASAPERGVKRMHPLGHWAADGERVSLTLQVSESRPRLCTVTVLKTSTNSEGKGLCSITVAVSGATSRTGAAAASGTSTANVDSCLLYT